MMRFDYDKLADEINAYLNIGGYGARERLIEKTGVPSATINRMRARQCQNVDSILAVCFWLSLPPENLILR